MPYACMSYKTIEDLTRHINDFAQMYASFRVIGVFTSTLEGETTAITVLVWFSINDYEDFTHIE